MDYSLQNGGDGRSLGSNDPPRTAPHSPDNPMSLLTPLIAFHLRQAIPQADGDVADFVGRRLAQPAGPLAAALDYAAGRAWRALAVALAPARFLGLVRAAGAADAVWIEDQLRRFMDQATGRFGDLSEKERAACLAEWLRAQEQGRIAVDDAAGEELSQRTAAHARRDDPAGLAEGAGRAEALVADALAADQPRLARLLRAQAGDPPLLAAAFAYFFRREVESNEDLSGELMCDGLRRLSAPLAGPLAGLGQALARLGSRFDGLVAQLLEDAAAKAVPAQLADRPSPFVALRGIRKGAGGERRSVGDSAAAGSRPSAYLVSPSGVTSPLRPAPRSLRGPARPSSTPSACSSSGSRPANSSWAVRPRRRSATPTRRLGASGFPAAFFSAPMSSRAASSPPSCATRIT